MKKRLTFCALLGLLLMQTACSYGVNVNYEEVSNPEMVISENTKLENVRVLELDINHEESKRVLNTFGDDLKDGIYAYDKNKHKTYILINSTTRNYSDYSFKFDKEKKILTLTYTTTEGSNTNKKTLFLLESYKKNPYNEIKLVNNGNDDGFIGVYTQ
ncbi:hypothetical protein ACE1MS_12345 [Lysinibacillus sp. fkY74-1]|uniref:Lipoprotein n=2 Tax=Lysinibacillus TaxID=400634 RepID=W7SAF6_LYSSH|nr:MULTISPECIES: hypothetical protein [Lysinibacillus]MBE5083584.1 hypothetical protein [Bacillus thuringiensis]AMO33399.1 hypothetical protein AR327_13600 [Lysinibacillus sphaericus]AMR91498.1 hypothetical protein A1T07_15620 [Lysinibacillus sphaericus]ANA45545.1 hypothetical protein A2J09_08280 [Lysinibacillus sphaericus]EWH33433.1 hypothetical protein P799_10795 [Lysinibacillus sphaericus CBAM5]